MADSSFLKMVSRLLALEGPVERVPITVGITKGFSGPYTGRSKTHKGHVRAIKKRQRRRAYLCSLRGG